MVRGDDSAGGYDRAFCAEGVGDVFARTVAELDPGLPAGVEPYSFLSSHLLACVSRALALVSGDVLVDLGCGRGGPGLWLARQAEAHLIGVDFSSVAVTHASRRAAQAPDRRGRSARFRQGDLAATGLPDAVADALVSIDALHFPADRAAAVGEVWRVLRPGGRLVLTGWHPVGIGDERLPERHRGTDWPASLTAAGFTVVDCATDAAWDRTFRAVYTAALAHGDPGGDAALAGLQDEARRLLPAAHLLRRVLVTAAR
ncbi:class I SAM-dependent methyltransferase [Actinomadura napierensis]|uniref:Methyltransferase type 11 domain-containing protein n=1 Tax=Actinomadura napierensis TaxID=267854 RepID=A0ABN2Z3I9_9ACTN